MLRGEHVHSDLSMEAEGPVVSKVDEALHPTSTQVSEQLDHSDGHGIVKPFPKKPHRRQDQVHRLDAFRKGWPEVGRLSSGFVKT